MVLSVCPAFYSCTTQCFLMSRTVAYAVARWSIFRVPTPLEMSWIFSENFQVPVSPGNYSLRSWNVLEFACGSA